MGRNNLIGAWGESVAAEYMRSKRYRVISTGFRCRFGEIDLVAQNRKCLVFVEVKLRKNDEFAMAMEHVDRIKQDKIKKTAQIYLADNPTKLQPRFDVIEIYAPQGIDTDNPTVIHLEGAFE